jgi:hypothetical protein
VENPFVVRFRTLKSSSGALHSSVGELLRVR